MASSCSLEFLMTQFNRTSHCQDIDTNESEQSKGSVCTIEQSGPAPKVFSDSGKPAIYLNIPILNNSAI